MAATGNEIALPFNAMAPEGRTRGTLLSVARELPGEWTSANGTQRAYGLGATFVPWGCDDLQTIELECQLDEDEPTFGAVPDAETFNAFRVVDALNCSTLSVEPSDLEERLMGRMEIMLSAALTNQLVNPTLTANKGLASEAVVLGDSVSVLAALVRLEDHLADVMHGGLGVLHLTPGILLAAVATGGVYWNGDRWVTPSGHTVIGDAGFTGTVGAEAGGAPTAGAGEKWVYASGPVWYSLRSARVLGTLASGQEGDNIWDSVADAYAVTLFDPCTVGAVLVGAIS